MDAIAGSRRGSTAGSHVAPLFALLISANALASPGDGAPQLVGSFHPFLKAAVERAFADALARLGDERCEKIFADFQDPEGRPLALNLNDLRKTARAFLLSERFVDGDHEKTCAEPGIFAFTHPHAGTIYLCGMRFASLQHTNPVLAAALILHEELHSLGLGENPPLSREITSRVMAACRMTLPAAPTPRVEREAGGSFEPP